MQHPEDQQAVDLSAWDWRAALRAHPIGRYGGLGWLADTLGMPRRTVYAYSAGQRAIPARWLRDVAVVLGHEGNAHADRSRSGD